METEVRIERASMKDLDEIYEIEVECFGREAYSKWIYRWLLKDEKTIFLKAVRDDVILGFVVGRVERSGKRMVGRIYTINVRPELRGKGIGKLLMNVIEDSFKREGCEEIILEVAVDNHPAINLYRSMGYDFIGKLENYYGAGRDAYRAVKKLSRRS
ncbi:MAG TPA: N-acetyltransferase [Nitrososphaeria archaeon]|nr:N-acetyltransferase [Nitrososphaeria archaeon]